MPSFGPGHVLTAQPADERCTLELEEYDGDRPAIHQSSWRHVIQLPSGNAPLKRSNEVCAAIETPLGVVEPCTVSACACIDEDDSEDGQLDVRFDMKVPGEHKLHVIQNGHHVHGSPCKINVEGFPLKKITDTSSVEVQALSHVFAASPAVNAVKCGLYIPKKSQSHRGGVYAAGVALFTRGEQGTQIRLGIPLWLANGEFAFGEGEHRGKEQQAVEVESCEQEWEDEEVMQMEFSYLHPQWMLKLTHLRSGKSSIAQGNLKSQLYEVMALVRFPENSPMYLLPAFF